MLKPCVKAARCKSGSMAKKKSSKKIKLPSTPPIHFAPISVPCTPGGSSRLRTVELGVPPFFV